MHAFYFVTNVIAYKALLVYEKGGKLVHKSFITVIAKGVTLFICQNKIYFTIN